MAKQNLGGVYANMDFPPYVWQEYPKHVTTGPHGLYEVAHSAEEEEKIKARLQKEYDDAPAEYVPYVADPAKEILVSRARELGVPFNSKWSKSKLQQVVQDAEDAVDSLPPEETPAKKPALVIEDDAPGEEEVDEQAELVAKAKALGVKGQGMHLWGIPRLKAAITEANIK